MRNGSKKGRYFLRDNFYRFYARFIYRNMSLYQGGRYDLLTEKTFSEWNAFTGKAFEEMVREILREELSGEYDRVGSWWNRRGDDRPSGHGKKQGSCSRDKEYGIEYGRVDEPH